MVGDPYEVAVLVARLAFAVLLYLFVGAALWVMWRDLRTRTGAATAPRLATTPTSPRLSLMEAPRGASVPGSSVPVHNGLVVGRRRPSDVVLDDEFVSGQHARFRFAQGTWWLEDLGSTNGTYVNGRRVDGPVALASADQIALGQVTWRFEIGE